MKSKILIVEDEPLIAEDLAILLKKEGYDIIGPAYDGLHALDLIYTQKPDLVLLDIALETNMSGLDVAEKINNSSKTPFIFITSFADQKTLQEAKKLLPYSYIVKPFKKKDILAAVEITLYRLNSNDNSQGHFKSLQDLNSELALDLHVTPKEYEIIMDVISGLANADIAAKHYISINTVKTHLKRSFAKLDIDSRTQLTSLLVRN